MPDPAGCSRGERAVALVLAAGRGVRLGAEVPKAWVPVEGRTLLEWSVRALRATPGIDAVLPVVPRERVGALGALDWGDGRARVLRAIAGGESRQGSLARGLEALEAAGESFEWVAVHDAARCLIEPADVAAVLEAARRCGAALPVVSLADTIKEVDGARVLCTPQRSRYRAAQTPQVFRSSLLREALAHAAREGLEATDCSALIEARGGEVRAVAGNPENFKLTTSGDLERAATVLRRRGGGGGSMRIGQGFDVHRLVEGRPLVLGGAKIEHARGLDGHSDADVLAHAVADALLGALGAGDLGTHFPSSDARWRGAAGSELLAPVLERMRQARLRIEHVDTTVVAQEPRLGPHLERIRTGLARMLSAPEPSVNVKLKSTDRLGSIGRGEGIAAQAVVLLRDAP